MRADEARAAGDQNAQAAPSIRSKSLSSRRMSPRPDAMIGTALALTESAAADGWRGPDAYDGLWHRGPGLWSAGDADGR